MYESNNTIGDEIRYVFDRQKRQSKMGNTLDRPTFLMKKNFIQNTTTLDENLKQGTEYRDLGSNDVMLMAKEKKAYEKKDKKKNAKRKKKMAVNKKMKAAISSSRSYSSGSGSDSGSASDSSYEEGTKGKKNLMKDYQNFLVCSPL